MHLATGTQFNYYHVCQRKLWLFAHHINMEHTSDLVADGKLLGETTYPQRAKKYTELDLGVARIDFYDANKRIIYETKRGKSFETAHEWQLKYYLFLLKGMGITDAYGVLEYPALRQTTEVYLSQTDEAYIKECLVSIRELIDGAACPPKLTKKTVCRKCAYFDFCWSS